MRFLATLLRWSFLGASVMSVWAWSKNEFVESLVREYRAVDQAGRADVNRDGLITSYEFQQSLYQLADINGNSDKRVTREEFVDAYASHYNVTSELAVIMFDLLNDPNSQDDVITSSDVSLLSFLGREYASVDEYRTGLEKWLRQAAERLHHYLTSPHVIGRNQNENPRYEGFANIDSNRDDVIQPQEIQDEINRYDHGQPVSRASWVRRNVKVFGADPVASTLTFDLWDSDGDKVITPRDLPATLRDIDADGDDRVTIKEFLRYIERGYKLSRKLTGSPIQHSLVACPVPWWSPNDISPSIDAIRAAMDFDDDFDGWISLDDLTRWVAVFDANNDQSLDRGEFEHQQMSRYGINASVASAMFDMADSNGDGRLDADDWDHHFQDDNEISFCDGRRSILDLVRLAETFQEVQEGPERGMAMKQRLQQEWAWYARSNLMVSRAGTGMRSPFRGNRNRNLCQGRRACYEGEYTSAWGLPGASMWWASDPGSRQWEEGMVMNHPVSMQYHPWSGVSTARVFPFRRSTFSQIPFRKQANPQMETSTGGSKPFFSFRRNDQEFRSSQRPPFSSVSNPNQSGDQPIQDNNAGPFFKRYQHLFGHMGRDSVDTASDQVINKGDTGNSASRFDSLRNTDGTFASSQANTLRENNFGSVQGNVAQEANRKSGGGKVGWTSMPRNNMQQQQQQARQQFPTQPRAQMPVIGVSTYPVVLGLDPWFLGGYPARRWNGRKKRQGNEIPLPSTGNGGLDVVDQKIGIEFSEHARTAREARTIKEKSAKAVSPPMDIDEKSNGTIDDFASWHRPVQDWNQFAPFPFQPTPYDMWMTAMMEKLLWESLTNYTDGNLNDTDISDIWERMSQWLQNELEKSHDGEAHDDMSMDESEASSRTKRESHPAIDNAAGMLEGDFDVQDMDARKQYTKLQRFRRNPYYNAIRNWMQWHDGMFGQHKGSLWPFRAYNNDQWFASPGYQSPWYFNRKDSGHPSYFPGSHDYSEQSYARRRRKRHASGYSDDVKKDLFSRSQSPRGFSFGKWLSTKGRGGKSRFNSDRNDNTQSPTVSSSNVWRGAVNEYGRENNWREHLKSGSRQWGSSSAEKFDLSDEKWSSGRDPMARFRAWQSKSRNPLMGGNWWRSLTGTLPSLNSFSSFGPREKNNGLPRNYAAFFIRGSPSNGFESPFRTVGMGDNPSSDYSSRPWSFPSRKFNSENSRWREYSNNEFAGVAPMYKNLNGNIFAGWGGNLNPWNKRLASESSRQKKNSDGQSTTPTRKNRSSFILDKQNLAGDDTRLSDKSNAYKEDGAERSRREAVGGDDFDFCRNYQQAGMGKLPWQSWNFMKDRFSRKAEQRMKRTLSGDSTDKGAEGNTIKPKRGSGCYGDYVSNQLQQMNQDFSRLRKTARWVRSNGWASQDRYPWESKNWNDMIFPFMFSSMWNPRFFSGKRNSMRYPRNSRQEQADEKENNSNENRVKREAAYGNGYEKWNNWWSPNPMMFSHPWWNGVGYRPTPWSSIGKWNSMIYPRRFINEQMGTENSESTNNRFKRDISHVIRDKRFNNWWSQNSLMQTHPYWQKNWNGMNWKGMSWNGMNWNGMRPLSIDSSHWYPQSFFGGWNSMRYPRNSEEQKYDNGEQSSNKRVKRETMQGDRDKRWKGWEDNQNWMMPSYPQDNWYGGYRNGMKYSSMYSSSYRYPRNSKQLHTDEEDPQFNKARSKREANDGNRGKTWSNWWNQNSMRQSHPLHEGSWNELNWNYKPYTFTSFLERYPCPYFGDWNPMRHPRSSKQQSREEQVNQSKDKIFKRDATHDGRERRWNNWWNQKSMVRSCPWWQWPWDGMRYPYMSSFNRYPWSSFGNWNSMRYPRNPKPQQGNENNEPIKARVKRVAMQGHRETQSSDWYMQHPMMYSSPWWQANWSGMRYPYMYSSNWYPWSSSSNWNSMRYPRESKEQAGEKDDEDNYSSRSKRETLQKSNDRGKRWTNGWSQNSMAYPFQRWNGNWNGMQWNDMNYPSMFSYSSHPWNSFSNFNLMRYPRNSGQQEKSEGKHFAPERNKREARQADRDKRWNMRWNHNSIMQSYPWWLMSWSGMGYPYNRHVSSCSPWSSLGNCNFMRFSRNSGGMQTEINRFTYARSKRDTQQDNRDKRWSTWWNYNSMMQSRPWWQGNWNGMNWNDMRYPSMYSSNWYPWQYFGNWNSMRYPRDSLGHETEEDKERSSARSKRETIQGHMEKRWNNWGNQNSMMHSNPWSQGNWNGRRSWNMYHSNWNPWFSFGSLNSMRYPRKSEEEKMQPEDSQNTRSKRDTEKDGRDKRWKNWWNHNSMMQSHPGWPGNWNGINGNGMRYPSTYFSNWYPWPYSDNWNPLRYPRDSKQEGMESDSGQQTGKETGSSKDRTKRGVIQADREKRWNNWWNQHSMMSSNPWWQGNWNRMRYPYMHSSNWYPWSSFSNLNSIRYPRASLGEYTEEDKETDNARSKREAIQRDREKRGNNWWNENSMMYLNPWGRGNWNEMRYPFMYYSNKYPWSSFSTQNSMRYPRISGQEEMNTEDVQSTKPKMDTHQSDRDKRWTNWWNYNSMVRSHPWWQDNWNGMNWNGMWYPFMYSSNWYPWPYSGNWNSMRYPRDSKQERTEIDSEQAMEKETGSSNDRVKREVIRKDREKRWNNLWNQHSMMSSNPWYHGNWIGMRYPYMYSSDWYPGFWFGTWNSMGYPREPREQTEGEQSKGINNKMSKREATYEETDRDKRWNNWSFRNPMPYPSQWWNENSNIFNWIGMRYPSMFAHSSNPWYQDGDWYSMRYPRKSEHDKMETDGNLATRARSKRDTLQGNRDKRWNNWWNYISMYQSRPWWQGNWNGMNWKGIWYPSMYSSNWYPWSHFSNRNARRHPRDSLEEKTEENNETGNARSKRAAIRGDREKRWNNWWNENAMMYLNPWWQGNSNTMRHSKMYRSYWNPRSSSGNWDSMRYSRKSEEEKMQPEDSQYTRSKRDAEKDGRDKRWKNWWNHNSMIQSHPWWPNNWNGINGNGMRYPSMYFSNWYPWPYSDNWNPLRYPRDSKQEGMESDSGQMTGKETGSSKDRTKRGVIQADREKRWNNWWNQHSMMSSNPWWQGNWNRMRYPYMHSSNWYPWSSFSNLNSIRYPREYRERVEDGENEDINNKRSNREETHEEINRDKRWNNWWNYNSMMQSRPWWQSDWNGMNWKSIWYPSMYSSNWYPWSHFNNRNSRRHPRDSLEEKTEENNETVNTRSKRAAIQGDREKRWNNWWNENPMMYLNPWWQGNWNGMRYPFMYYSNEYPWSSFGTHNSMRYPRISGHEEMNTEGMQSTKSKRDIQQSDRDKRWTNWWNHNSMMQSHPWWQDNWNGMNWNGMRYPSMYSSNWYLWPYSGNWNSMRSPRDSKQEEMEIDYGQQTEKEAGSSKDRTKREAIQENREKRWNNLWNQHSMMSSNPWYHGNWNTMRYPYMYSSNRYPWPSFGNWNSMKYSREYRAQMDDGETKEINNNIFKREATQEKTNRDKWWNHWWFQNSMAYPSQWWNGKSNKFNWNGMRYPSMFSHSSYPWYHYQYGNWYSMRYPRKFEHDEMKTEGNQAPSARSKRDTQQDDRDKRWNNRWNYFSMMQSNPWWQGNWKGMNWNGMRYTFMGYPNSYPWSHSGNWNSIRYPRDSLGQETEEDKERSSARSKRETIQGHMEKRWNNFWSQNSMMYSNPWWHGNWNGMRSWNMHKSNWNPWLSRGNWNSMRYPRKSEQKEIIPEDRQSTMSRRDAQKGNIDKRWNNWWNYNSMMRGNWNGIHWNGMSYPFMYSSNSHQWPYSGNSMRYTQDSKQEGKETDSEQEVENETGSINDGSKREAIQGNREKRWNNWWNHHSMMYLNSWYHGNWNAMKHPYMYSSNWYPWPSFGNWNSMRYPRESRGQTEDGETEDINDKIFKRETTHEESDRDKRWNNWWSQNSMVHPSQWLNRNSNIFNWNGMRYPYMYSSNWCPWSPFCTWNSMRYQRDFGQEEMKSEDTQSTRYKRDTQQGDSDKRWSNWWNYNSMMQSHPWWQGNWNRINWKQFNWLPWSYFTNRNTLRYPRTSKRPVEGDDNQYINVKHKRQTLQDDSDKRWNNLGNLSSMLYSYPWWQGNWNRMRHPSIHFFDLYPWSSFNNWNSMRYSRHSKQQTDENHNQGDVIKSIPSSPDSRRQKRSLNLSRHNVFQENLDERETDSSPKELAPSKTTEKREGKTKPMFNTLKSYLSRGNSVSSKVYRTALKGLGRDNTQTKKRTWNVMAMRKKLLENGLSPWNNKNWVDGWSNSPENNNWFMGWIIRSSYDNNSDQTKICDLTSGWNVFCTRRFWYNVMMKAFWNRYRMWMNNYYNNNNNIFYPGWSPPRARIFSWYPKYLYQLDVIPPWSNGHASLGGGSNHGPWSRLGAGWDPNQWPRALAQKRQAEGDE